MLSGYHYCLEVMNNAQILETLHNVPAGEGLSTQQLDDLAPMNFGFGETIGVRFTKVSHEAVSAELHVGAKHLQITGVVNGGVYCSMAETVGSVMGIVASQGNVVLGVNNNTDLLRSVAAGVITATATVIRAGKRTQLINVDMVHKGELVARTTLRTMVVPVPSNTNPGRRENKFEVGS